MNVRNLHYLDEKVKEMAQTRTSLQCQNYAGPPLHPKVVVIVSKNMHNTNKFVLNMVFFFTVIGKQNLVR
jgi:hypothetical protein